MSRHDEMRWSDNQMELILFQSICDGNQICARMLVSVTDKRAVTSMKIPINHKLMVQNKEYVYSKKKKIKAFHI